MDLQIHKIRFKLFYHLLCKHLIWDVGSEYFYHNINYYPLGAGLPLSPRQARPKGRIPYVGLKMFFGQFGVDHCAGKISTGNGSSHGTHPC